MGDVVVSLHNSDPLVPIAFCMFMFAANVHIFLITREICDHALSWRKVEGVKGDRQITYKLTGQLLTSSVTSMD